MEKNNKKGLKNKEVRFISACKEHGITLIALIITIILMLILVGVGIQIAIDGKLIGTAEESANKWNNKVATDQNRVDDLMGDLHGVIQRQCSHEFEEWTIVKEATCIETGSKIRTCTKCGYIENEEIAKASHNIVDKICTVCGGVCTHNYAIPEGAGIKYTKTKIYNDGTNTAMIPKGFTVSGIGGTCTICGEINPLDEITIKEGLVIYLIYDKTDKEIELINWNDPTTQATLKENYDQFVWIPIKNSTDENVEDINDMYICQNKGKTNYGSEPCIITVPEETGVATCTKHGNCTEMAGRLYANNYGESFGLGITETYKSGSGLREPDTVSKHDGNTTYLGYVNGILQTSYTNATTFKTGLQTEYNSVVKSVYENQGFYVGRYETSNITTTNGTAVTVRAGKTPTHSIDWYYMYAQQVDYATNNGLTLGSTMIQGTAYDQVLKFVNSENYSVTSGGNVGHLGTDFTTKPYLTGKMDYDTNYHGSVLYNDAPKNIYDLEGNLREWTLEARDSTYRMIRGGDYDCDISASARSFSAPTTGNMTMLGTRCLLYVQ